MTLKEAMDAQWRSCGVQQIDHLAGWTFGNGSLSPRKGKKIYDPTEAQFRAFIRKLRK